MTGNAIAEAAEACLGTPFVLHGRDPAAGLDCIGLIEQAIAATGGTPRLPRSYALRTSQWAALPAIATGLGFVEVTARLEAGDICLIQPAPAQWHFAVAACSQAGLIEAHAGLRRVVRTPLPYPHPILRRWRWVGTE